MLLLLLCHDAKICSPSSAAGSSRATSWQRAEAWKSALRIGRKFLGIAGAIQRATLPALLAPMERRRGNNSPEA